MASKFDTRAEWVDTALWLGNVFSTRTMLNVALSVVVSCAAVIGFSFIIKS